MLRCLPALPFRFRHELASPGVTRKLHHMSGASSQHYVDCSVVGVNGDESALTVPLVWSVARLKECIEHAMGIPCYAQVLSDGKRKLRSTDVLRDVYLEQNGEDSRLVLFCMFATLPPRINHEEAQRVWEAFCIFSTDFGDSVHTAKLRGIFDFIGYRMDALELHATCAETEFLRFEEVLTIILEWKEELTAEEAYKEESFEIEIGYPFGVPGFSSAETKIIRDAIHLCLIGKHRRRAASQRQSEDHHSRDGLVHEERVCRKGECEARSSFQLSL
eukprot:TRINITY_DN14526_c1_g1_i1.p1 TRINITY_DN14526_c1_g1~~TRINITY_DN14526_c1_g1_i1.p1  ORF type:complete len:275 (-),score=28.74 TRINITY_DN14526_c1_g1_i1:476-1300(-)